MKKHKLVLIAPSGKKHTLGFIAPSKDGLVIGTPKIEGIETSHLTVLHKEKTLSSHITAQEGEKEVRSFPRLKLEKIKEILLVWVENELLKPLSPEAMSQEAVYFTEKFFNWYKKVESTLYHEEETAKVVFHIIDFKSFLEKFPKLIEELAGSPSSYFGACEIGQILEDESKVIGFTADRSVVIPIEGSLYSATLPLLTGINFEPALDGEQLSNPIDEIFQSMGIPQYLEEIQKKNFLEKLLSNE